jgi:outer membrane protein, heavy metal efflux system
LFAVRVQITACLLLMAAAAQMAGEENKVQIPAAQAATQKNYESEATKDSTVTLQQVLALAEANSPLLQGAQADIVASRYGISAARVYPNPRANYLVGPQFARPVSNPGAPGLLQHYGASQPIELPGFRKTRIEAARLGQESSEFGLAGVQLAVRSAVKHAFYDVLRRKEEINHAQENLNILTDLRRRIQVQVNVGEGAKLELIRADAEIAVGQNAVRSARLQYFAALSVLRAAVNGPLAENVNAEGELSRQVSLPPLETLRQDVIAHYPALAQANTEFRRAEAILANEREQRKPQPQIDFEYELQPDLQYFRFGVSIPIPAFDRRKGQIGMAAAAVTRARAIGTQRRLEITAELERAYQQYQIADQQVKSFEAGALRQATAALDAAQAAYRLGARGIIEVLDAQRVLQTVRGDLLDAQYARQNALVDLESLGAIKLGDAS